MEECHICGRPAVGRGVVEGVAVWLCGSCMSFGKPVTESQPQKPLAPSKHAATSFKPALTAPRPPAKPIEHSVVEDFGNIIVAAREKLGLTRRQLARQLFVMENVLERIEHGHLVPDIKIAEKLEKALGIRLVVEESGSREKNGAGKPSAGFGGVSMADVVDVKVGK